MFNADEARETLTQKLSEQYSKNTINMEEYERILEYINKLETRKELNIIEKIIRENSVKDSETMTVQSGELTIPKNGAGEKHLSMFSWRTINAKSINGNAGKFMSLFGTNRIIVDNLPGGRTVMNVNSIFGLTEILVSKKVKVTNRAVPIFSGIFGSSEINNEEDGQPELYLTGKAVFGNITIKRLD